jgi:5-carboxymethyl-2-hydroxymuconate isomerase
MPHINLKISANLSEFAFHDFAKDAHAILKEYANIEKCKSKMEVIQDFYIGSDPSNKGFVYLEVLVLQRPEETLKAIGQKLYDLLNAKTLPLIHSKNLRADINLEVRVLQHYWQP